MEFEDFRGGSSSSQGKPSSSPPPFWPGWGKPGKHSVAELGGIAQKGKQAQTHLGTFRLHSLCPVHHTDALGLKKKLFSRPSHTGWAGPQDGAGQGVRHGTPPAINSNSSQGPREEECVRLNNLGFPGGRKAMREDSSASPPPTMCVVAFQRGRGHGCGARVGSWGV